MAITVDEFKSLRAGSRIRFEGIEITFYESPELKDGRYQVLASRPGYLTGYVTFTEDEITEVAIVVRR